MQIQISINQPEICLSGGTMRSSAEPTKSLHYRIVVSCEIIFLLLAISAAIVYGVNRQPNPLQTNQIRNKTSALEVVSVTSIQDQGFTLTVRNVLSTRNITGLAFASESENVKVQVDFITGFVDESIPPGKTYSRTILPFTKGKISPSDISILAVVLDDGTVNGESLVGQNILDQRKGKKEQLKLILPIIKNAIDSKAANAVVQVITDINKMPHPHDAEMPYQIKSGAHSIRELILSKIQDHANRGTASPTEDIHALVNIYSEYSSLLSKL
jgi:hypothetical protein